MACEVKRCQRIRCASADPDDVGPHGSTLMTEHIWAAEGGAKEPVVICLIWYTYASLSENTAERKRRNASSYKSYWAVPRVEWIKEQLQNHATCLTFFIFFSIWGTSDIAVPWTCDPSLANLATACFKINFPGL